MVNYLLKKSYRLKDLKEIEFNDLWGDHGVFTTMWIFDKPSKILFFKEHINNLIKSSKTYSVFKKTLSISLRKRIKPKLNFDLKLVKLKRQKPEFKNLKYKEILKHLTKLDNSRTDIGLCSNNKIFETGTSNLLFVKNGKVFSPINKFYRGITYNFFRSKIKKIIKKDILVNSLKDFDEIILIGSGKGVASVKSINQIKWKRKNLKFYNILSRHYKSAISNCKIYR